MNFLNERKLPLDVPLDTLLLLSETRIACVDATEFLSAVYKYFIIPLTRHFVSTSPSGGEVKNTGCNF